MFYRTMFCRNQDYIQFQHQQKVPVQVVTINASEKLTEILERERRNAEQNLINQCIEILQIVLNLHSVQHYYDWAILGPCKPVWVNFARGKYILITFLLFIVRRRKLAHSKSRTIAKNVKKKLDLPNFYVKGSKLKEVKPFFHGLSPQHTK